MAQSSAAVQAQLGATLMNAQIIRAVEGDPIGDATHQQWYVSGNADAPGKVRFCTTLASDSAATQAASILTSLRA